MKLSRVEVSSMAAKMSLDFNLKDVNELNFWENINDAAVKVILSFEKTDNGLELKINLHPLFHYK